MSKLILSNLVNLQNENTAVATINANNLAIENAVENTLSRDGTTPNQMSNNLDMNSNRILNLPVPSGSDEPVRKIDLENAELTGGAALLLPLSPNNGGTGLSSYTAGDTLYALSSGTINKLPKGTTGQILTQGVSVPSWTTPVNLGTTGSVTATDSTAVNRTLFKLGTASWGNDVTIVKSGTTGISFESLAGTDLVTLNDAGKTSMGVTTPYWDGINTFRPMLSIQSNSTSALIPHNTTPSTGEYIGEAMQVTHGSIATPITNSHTPTVSVHRVENINVITSDGSDAAAIQSNMIAYGAQQAVGIASRSAKMVGSVGDVCSIYGTAIQQGNGYSFGGFFQAIGNGFATGAKAYAVETVTNNNTLTASPYVVATVPLFCGLDVTYDGGASNNNGGTAVLIRAANPSATVGIWDAGIVFLPHQIASVAIQDDSDSVNILRATGSHTAGVNFTGATFSGNSFSSPNFTVDGTSGRVISGSSVKTGSFLVAALPSPDVGARAFVTNCTTNTFNAVAAGGGGLFVPVFGDGSVWRVG